MIERRRRAGVLFFALSMALAFLLAVAQLGWGQSSDLGGAPQTPPDDRVIGVKEPAAEAPDSSRLLRKAEREGSVRVIVRLRTDFVPEGRLSRPRAAHQRGEIDSFQKGLRAGLQGTGYRTLRQYDTIPFIALELSPEALREVERSPRVADVVEDRPLLPLLADSAPLVQAPSMWSGGYTASGQVIAVLDTGVDSSHPFLDGKVVEEACYSAGSDCPNRSTTQTGAGSGAPCTYAARGCAHGTHVAGIAAGEGSGFSGVARGASIMAIQVFSRSAGPSCAAAGENPCTLSFISDQIKGLERVYALRSTHNFASVNMSLGSGRFSSNCDAAWQATKLAIDNLRSVGIATVTSSGNEGYADSMNGPACISSAVSVGSTSKADTASFTNSASFLSLLAPGTNITSSVPGGGFAIGSGTSMAAPHVAGAWALLKEQNPSASVDRILSALQSTGTPVRDPRNGLTKPRINVARAAAALKPVANDDFANALELTGATVTGTNNGATKEAGESDHAGNAGGRSVWYRWTPETSGTATIDTAGSDFDTLLAVYTGSAVNGLTPVAANDDANGGVDGVRTSEVDFPLTAGTTYQIAVDGHNDAVTGTAAGNLTLHLASTAPDTTPPTVNLGSPADGAVVKGTTVALSAEAADNVGVQGVEFLANGSVVGTDTTAPYSVSWDSTTMTDGFVTLGARAFDAAGNSTITDPGRAVILNNTSPETLGPATSVVGGTATFEFFSSENDSTFRCSLDGAPFSPCSSPATFLDLGDGEHTFRVFAVGAAGEADDSDTTPASRTWTIDTVAPGAPIISGPANDGFDNTGNFTVSGTAEPASTVELFDGTTSLGTVQASAAGDWSKTLGGVVEGSHTYTARATDAAGNTSAVSNARTVVVDTTRPTITISTPADGATYSSDQMVTADYSCRDETGGSGISSCDGNVPGGSAIDTAASVGTRTFTVTATDKAGNQHSVSHTYTIDGTPPETTLGSGPSGTVNVGEASFEFSSSEADSTFECKLDDGAYGACTSPKDYVSLSDGPHVFLVRATDGAGNVGPVASRTWMVDATAPTVGAVEPADGSTGVAVAANAAATFSEPVDASTITPSSFTLVKQGATTPVAATVSYDSPIRKATLTPDANLDPDSVYTATLKGGTDGVKDLAGNALAQNRVWSFRTAAPQQDTTPPSMSLGSPADGEIIRGPDLTLSANASDNVGISKVEFLVNGTVVGTDTAANGNEYSVTWDSTTVGDGKVAITALATDAAGNKASDSRPEVVVDNLDPATFISFGPASITGSSRATFRFYSPDRDVIGFLCSLDGRRWTRCSSPKSYTGLSRRRHTLRVRAVGSAGMAMDSDPTPATRSWTVKKYRR
jgi:subtilisin